MSLLYPWIIQSVFDQFLRYVSLDPMGPELSKIQEARHEMLNGLIAIELGFLVVTFGVSIFLSHRIAGPLYKLTRFLTDQGPGKLVRRISFRKADHFQEIASAYNEMLDSINQKVTQAVTEIEKGRSAEGLSILRSLQSVGGETTAQPAAKTGTSRS